MKLLLAIFLAMSFYNIAIAARNTIILTDKQESYELGYHFSILEDATGKFKRPFQGL
ncbi:hypothetical protein OAK75_07510 [Bacteriovoracales bacterium]|nr:hypothetical protein [Bacteriovoracales bacterium]